MTLICVGDLTIIGSDNGLAPSRRQAIIWINAGIFLIQPLGTNFSEILIEILTFSFKKMHLKVSSAKRRPFCLGLIVLMLLFSLVDNSATLRILTCTRVREPCSPWFFIAMVQIKQRQFYNKITSKIPRYIGYFIVMVKITLSPIL